MRQVTRPRTQHHPSPEIRERRKGCVCSFPRPHAQPWFLPQGSLGRAPPSLAIRHRKKSRGQDGAVALTKGRREFVGVGAQTAGLVCEWGAWQAQLESRKRRVGCVAPETRTAQASVCFVIRNKSEWVAPYPLEPSAGAESGGGRLAGSGAFLGLGIGRNPVEKLASRFLPIMGTVGRGRCCSCCLGSEIDAQRNVLNVCGGGVGGGGWG